MDLTSRVGTRRIFHKLFMALSGVGIGRTCLPRSGRPPQKTKGQIGTRVDRQRPLSTGSTDGRPGWTAQTSVGRPRALSAGAHTVGRGLIHGPEELTRAQRRALVRHLRRAQYRGGPGTRAGQQKCGSIAAAFWNTKILIFRWARLRREPGSDAGPAQERARPRTTLHECVADAFAALLV